MIAPVVLLPLLRTARQSAAEPAPLPLALAAALIFALSAGGWALVFWSGYLLVETLT